MGGCGRALRDYAHFKIEKWSTGLLRYYDGMEHIAHLKLRVINGEFAGTWMYVPRLANKSEIET